MGGAQAARKDLVDVTSVPGKSSPNLGDRYLYWRSCRIFFTCMLGSFAALFALSESVRLALAWRRKLRVFPIEVREYFTLFVLMQVLGDIVTNLLIVVSVSTIFKAKNAPSIEKSSKHVRTAWIVGFMARIVPWLLFAYAFFVRTDYIERDICANTIAVMLKNPLLAQQLRSKAHFEPTAMPTLQSTPPPLRSEEMKTWIGTDWCYRYRMRWKDRIFGTKWIQNAGKSKEEIEEAEAQFHFLTPLQGIMSQTAKSMAGACGIPKDEVEKFAFCGKEEDALTKKELKSLSLMETREESFRAGRSTSKLMRREKQARFFPLHHLMANENDPDERRRYELFEDEYDLHDEKMSLLAEALRSNQTVDPKAAKKLCVNAVCAVLEGVNMLIRIATMSSQISIRAAGAMCMFQAVKKLFPGMFAVFQGVLQSCESCKKVVPESSVPGYVAGVACLVSIPFAASFCGVLAQLGGHIALSVTFCCGVMLFALDLEKSDVMRIPDSFEKLQKKLLAIETRKKKFIKIAIVGAVIFVLHMIYLAVMGDPRANLAFGGLSLSMNLLDLIELDSLAGIIILSFYLKAISGIGAFEILFNSVFDSADDKLDQGTVAVMTKALARPDKKKKKKKKDKGDDDENDEKSKKDKGGDGEIVEGEWRIEPRTMQAVTLDELKQLMPDLGEEELMTYWNNQCVQSNKCKESGLPPGLNVKGKKGKGKKGKDGKAGEGVEGEGKGKDNGDEGGKGGEGEDASKGKGKGKDEGGKGGEGEDASKGKGKGKDKGGKGKDEDKGKGKGADAGDGKGKDKGKKAADDGSKGKGKNAEPPNDVAE
eukprot:TRINITY_DN1529_c0_g1_i1.p1 TRINITY_DN1529_c0_g1~~TRINITY_DN1529_c0_g1_i1.p1  ORF type:complete len:820 (-),score=139.43 TRINITY_DN1529_c0_g1_i1:126-2585(-)